MEGDDGLIETEGGELTVTVAEAVAEQPPAFVPVTV